MILYLCPRKTLQSEQLQQKTRKQQAWRWSNDSQQLHDLEFQIPKAFSHAPISLLQMMHSIAEVKSYNNVLLAKQNPPTRGALVKKHENAKPGELLGPDCREQTFPLGAVIYAIVWYATSSVP